MSPITKTIASLAISLILAGCEVGPNYRAPDVAVPDGFLPGATTQPSTTPSRVVDITQWWQSLGDPVLNELVARAIRQNPDIQIALARLQEARTQEVAVEGGALPLVDFSGSIAKGTGNNSTKNRVDGPLNAGTNSAGLKEITQVVGFDAGWELDLFGKYKREGEAARYETQAAVENRSAVLISVVSNVARAYLDTRALQLRLAIAQQNLGIQRQSVDLVQQRFDRGVTDEFDVALARRQYATLQASIAPLQSEISAAEHRVAVLLGEYAMNVSSRLEQSAALPDLQEKFQPGLPVELLRRRPDIREAERELAASTARIGVATAALYPRIGITAGVGFQGQGLGVGKPSDHFLYSVGPTAEWPLLDFGTLDALIDIQDLRTRERLITYRQTIVAAVEEVDDSISAYAAQQDRLRYLADARDASQRAVTLATQRYDRGLTDYLNVLDAQRQLYEIQDQYAVAQETVALQFIALYKALGGGWENYQRVPDIRKPQPAIVAAFQRASKN